MGGTSVALSDKESQAVESDGNQKEEKQPAEVRMGLLELSRDTRAGMLGHRNRPVSGMLGLGQAGVEDG
ncbi:hypothetical protein F0562_002637 [Nyssa sinensis]|uniref:Uncharacterized protein n=1 Tax=Nyssa sinensis TaxID=561372 RepID=A0A5J5BVH2_9ASTE|nr:hypothetical protein F0562_002637 [Nyssa sinensis]